MYVLYLITKYLDQLLTQILNAIQRIDSWNMEQVLMEHQLILIK